MKRFIRWLQGWRKCTFCGIVKPPSELSIGVVSETITGETSCNDFCIDCLRKRFEERKRGFK